jgi:hypothetical protein
MFIKKEKSENIAGDAGGPTRQFLDDFFKQMGSLAVKIPGGGADIKLFIIEPVGFVPQSDVYINHQIKREEDVDVVKAQLKAFYKAIGRIFASCLLSLSTDSPYAIAAQALPRLYRNGKL